MDFLYVVIAILLIGLLVLVHEIGHFAAARLTGVPVVEFAIGFGKRLIKWKRKGILYSLRIIPFGGFVAFADANDEDGIGNYYKQPVWKRLVTTVSGPLMNFIVAFVVAVIFTMTYGIVVDSKVSPTIGKIVPGSSAEAAGLMAGDRFIRVKGIEVNDNTDILKNEIASAKDTPFDVVIERQGKQLPVVLAARFDEKQNAYQIGINLKLVLIYERVGFGKAVSFSFLWMLDTVKQLLQFLFGLFTQGKGAGDVASPIGMVQQTVATVQEYGPQFFFNIGIFLSVNLGLFNLLPLPALDGSKVIFLLIEWVRGKPIPPEKEGVITAVGFGLFILLFIFLAGRDIARLFGWIQ